MTLLDQIAAGLRTRLGAALALLLLMLAFVLPGQTTIPPFDRDESRFAQASRQMLETGDFIDIRFGEVPRHLQPAGVYWLQAASVTVLGDADVRAIWPHRVPSWLAAIGVAFLTWWVAALLFGQTAGRIAGVLMGAALILNVEARMAKTDASLAFAIVSAQAMLAKAYMARERGERFPAWAAALFWVAMGAAGLLKGPIVLLVTGGTVLGLLTFDRKGAWLSALRPAWGVPLMLAIAAPWYVAIGVVTDWEFFRTALGYSVAGKISDSHQSHDGPFGYHLMLMPVTFWPGSLFALLAIPFAWAGRKTAPVRFCLAWILPAWLVFELSGTKLPHYTLPLLPALAALSAAAIVAAKDARFFGRPRLLIGAGLLWLLAGAVLVVGVPLVGRAVQDALAPAAAVLMALALIAMAAALALTGMGRPVAGVGAAAAAGLLAWINAFGVTLPWMSNAFMSPRIVAAAEAQAPCPNPTLVALEYHEPSLVFLGGTDTRLARTPTEAAEALGAVRACGMAVVGPKLDAAFRAEAARLGVPVRAAATVSGVNVNEGDDDLTVTIYRPE